MSRIQDFAEWFKARRKPVEKWYRDGGGRYAFRVTVDGQTFVCAVRSSHPKDGKTSIMKRVAGKAQTTDALIALRLPGGMRVFDPVTVLAHGESDEPTEDERKERGERWVKVDVGLSCGFDEWVDFGVEPARFADVTPA